MADYSVPGKMVVLRRKCFDIHYHDHDNWTSCCTHIHQEWYCRLQYASPCAQHRHSEASRSAVRLVPRCALPCAWTGNGQDDVCGHERQRTERHGTGMAWTWACDGVRVAPGKDAEGCVTSADRRWRRRRPSPPAANDARNSKPDVRGKKEEQYPLTTGL